MDGFKLTDCNWPSWLALLGAAAAALATVGCGQAAHTRTGAALAAPTAGAALVGRAARLTLAAPAGVELTLQGASAFGGSRAPVLGSGEFDFPTARGVDRIDLGESAGQEPGNEQALFLSGEVYLQPKGLGTTVLPPGKEWMSAGLTGSEAVDTNFPAFTLQVESVDPQLALSELAGGTVAAIALASELVGGLPARRYRATVDLAQALSALSGPDLGALAQAIQTELASPAPAGGGAGQVAIEVWIGAGGRVVQLRGSPPGSGAGTATMTLCCYGTPVQVSAPAPGRVVDIASLTPSGERENNGGGDSDGG